MAARRSRDAYLARLRDVPLFRACTDRDLKRIASAATDVTVREGREVIKEGASGQEFFVIVAGEATVRRGKRKVASLGPGDWFGELALLDKAPRTATVVADSDMELMVLDRSRFNTVLDDVPRLTHRLLVGTARRLREVETPKV